MEVMIPSSSGVRQKPDRNRVASSMEEGERLGHTDTEGAEESPFLEGRGQQAASEREGGEKERQKEGQEQKNNRRAEESPALSSPAIVKALKRSDAVSPKVADAVDKVMSQDSPTNSSQQQQPQPNSQHHHKPYHHHHHQPPSPAFDSQEQQQQQQQQFEVSGPESPRAGTPRCPEPERNMVTSTPGSEDPARAELRYSGYRAEMSDSLDKSGPEDDEEDYGSEAHYDIRSPGMYRSDSYPDRRLTFDNSMSPDKEGGEVDGEGRHSPEGPTPFPPSSYRHFPLSSAPFSSTIVTYHQDLARNRYPSFDQLAGNGTSTSVTYSYGTPPQDSPADPYSFEREREDSPGYSGAHANRERGPHSPLSRDRYSRYGRGDDPVDSFKRNQSFSPNREDRSPLDTSLLSNADSMSNASRSPKSAYPPSPSSGGAYPRESPRFMGGHPDLLSPSSGGKLRPVFEGGLPSLPLPPRFPGGSGALPPGYNQPQIGADGKHIYFCHLCSYSGPTKEEFDSHMSVHFEYNCPHCDYTSRTEGRLKRHIKDFHSDPDNKQRTMPGRPKVFKCKQCDFSCINKVEFWTHARTHIKEDKLLQCPRCPFVTEYKHHLEYHLRNHFGSKPFKCNKCNYSCVNKSMLNSHMKSHTNVYQYRCADCTYATKYCHSLKLHLRKYGHKPATVLNSDGSLPQGIDAEISGLSLLAKRGPPRGPRGLRKDKDGGMSEAFLPPTMCPPLYMPPGEMGPINPLLAPRGLMPSPYWPMMANSMHPPPPLIPVSMAAPPHPLLPGFDKLNSLRGQGVGGDEERESLSAIKCKMCSYSAETMEGLEAHVLKVHAAENKDLLSMLPFNIASESLLEDQAARLQARRMSAPLSGPASQETSPDAFMRRNTMPASESSPLRVHSKQALSELVKSGLSAWPQGREGVDVADREQTRSPFHPYARSLFPGKVRDSQEQDRDTGEPPQEGADIIREMTLKFGASPLNTSPSRPQLPVPPAAISQASLQGALDLTKPRSLTSPYAQSPPITASMPVFPTSATTESLKRKLSGEANSSEDNCCPSDLVAANPRKRSRKGKAYKLDALCLKLQEKQATSPYESDSQDSPLNDEATQVRERGTEVREEDSCREYSDKRVERAVGTEHPERAAEMEHMQKEAGNHGENMDSDFEQLQKNLQILNSNEPSADVCSQNMPEENHTSQPTPVDETATDEVKAVREEGSAALPRSTPPLVVREGRQEEEVDPVKERAAILSAIYKSRRDAVPPAIRRGTELALKIFNETTDGTSPPNGKTSNPSHVPVLRDVQDVSEASPKNGLTHSSLHKIILSKQPLNGCGDLSQSPPPAFPARMSTHAQTQPPSSASLAQDMPLAAKVLHPSPKKEVYECPYCEIAFRNGVMYSMHMGYHGTPNPYRCNICGQTSRDSVDFFLHIARAAHT